MTTSTSNATPQTATLALHPAQVDVRQLVTDFILLSELADPWADAELEDSEDCNVLAAAFTIHCQARDVDAVTVRVEMSHASESMLGQHFFTVLPGGVAVDFTARQFHNVTDMPLDVDEIAFPLVFLWPGAFPLPGLTATAADPEDTDRG